MTIDTIRQMLLWCSIINIGLLLISFMIFLAGRGWIYRVHTKWFRLSEEKFDAMWYGILGFYKICVIVFNVVPYIALCIVK